MAFYIDIAHPAREKALKKIRAQTEAEMDPMGFTATPRAPRAWEPDIPTQQVPLAPGTGGPMSQAEMIDAARAYPEQPEPGSIAANLGLDLQRKDTLPLATGQDIFSQAGRGAIKYGVEPTLATAEAWAQGIPYVSDVLAGETSRLNVPPGAPIGATPEPTADVLGLFRGQSPEEVGQQLLKSYYEKPLYGQILTDLFFNPINFAPIRIPGGPGGLRRFNIDPTSTLWRDAPAATKAAIKTGIQDQIGERVAAQVRQVAPDLAPNRVNEIVDILIDDFMKPGMRPEDFQKHADLVINRVRGYDRPPTARPTVSPDAAPVPALAPAAPVGTALPEAAVTPSPAAGVPEELLAEVRQRGVPAGQRVDVSIPTKEKPPYGYPKSAPVGRSSLNKAAFTPSEEFGAMRGVAPTSGSDYIGLLFDDVLDDRLGQIADSLGLDTVTEGMVRVARKEVEEATQASLNARGLPDEFTVWRGGNVYDDTPMPVSLDEATARFHAEEQGLGDRVLQSYTVKKSDVLADIEAFYPAGYAESELLVYGRNLTPSPAAVPTPVAADVPRYTPEEMDVATKTARGAGAVGGKAIVPLWIGDNVPANAKILDFGSGPTAQHTTRLREAGFTDVTAHEFGANIREGIHSPDALSQQYDVVFASNVLNVQSSEGMLRRTLESIRQALKEDGYAVFNYPGSPRKAGLSNNEVQSIIQDIFPSASRIEKKGQGPMWRVSGQSAPSPAAIPEPTPVPEVTQRIAPGSTDPVEIRSSYNRELSAYGARRIPIEDVEGISYSEALEKRRDHIDGLREVFENRIAAEGGSRVVSPNDIRRIGDDLLDEIRSQPEGQERVPRLIDLRTVRDVVPAEVGSHRVYHGTIATFDAFRLGAAHDDSLYGPGVYLTDDPNIASGYAKGSLRVTRQIGGPQHGQPIDSAGNVISEQEANFLAQGAPQIWSVDVEVVKFFDIDAPPDKEIMDIIKEDPDAWDRAFDHANYDIEDIKTNHELYQLMHADFGNKSEVNDWLAMLGYDTITHVGGGRTGNLPHRVYIALGDPYIGDEITSISPQFGPRRGKEPAVKVIEALPPAPTRPALQPGQAPAAEVPGPPALPAQPPMAALPPAGPPPPVAPTAAAAAPPPTPPPPPRGPEVFETGLDPEQPPTPFVPALVQDNLDRAALQIKLTTGEKGYLTQKWIGNWPNIPVRPTGQTLNNIPGISQFQGFFFPKYRMTLELHQSWVASGMTEWELNTQMGLSRANLFTELKTAFGEDALKGWKPPIPGDDIKGGIQQMARYYVENSNTVYLAPFIGDEAERRMFSGTLFDIATRPDMYELNEAQRAALATWKSHQDDFMDIIIAGYGVDVEKYAVPDNVVFLSNINVGEGAIEASQTTYQAVTSGGRKHRLFDTAAERQELNPDFIPETDIEVLQTGMDMAKAHWAAQSTLKLGSGGISKLELMEMAHPELVAAREATIRKVNSLKGRINTAERRVVSVQSELDLVATRIKNLDERIDILDAQIGELGLEYGPMLSHLSGELYSLKTVLSEAQKRSQVLVERGVGLVDTDKDLIAQLEEAAKDLKDIRERYAGALPTVKVQVGMTSKSINYKLVPEGGLYLYFPEKDVNGIEVAKAAREIVKAENNSIVKLLNNIQQTVLGGDLSPLAAIQGHLALIANPQQIIFKLVGAGKGSIQSRDMLHIFREETMNKVIEENWEDAQDLARYIGLPFIASTPAEFAGGFLKYLKGNIGGKEYSYVKANDAMFAITLRNMLTGYQTNMKMLAAEGITGEEAKIISAMVVSDNIPLINWRLAGLSAAQYNSRRALVTSASYIVKPAELVSSMTTGLAKVATGQTVTQRERLSLRIGFNMIATVTALSVATSMYAALRNDEDPVQAGLNAANPIHPDFATIHLSWTHLPYVQDQKLPMGGPFRAIAKMVAPREVSWSPVPVPFATLLQWAMNRVGPGLQAFVRAAHPEGRDFYGYKIRKGGGVEQAVRALLYGLEGVLPLMPQTLVGGLRRGTEFGENIADSTWQFFGTGARQDSAWQERNKSAARWAESQGLNYDVGGYKDLRGRDRKLYDDTVLGALQAEAVYQKVKKDAEVGQIPWAMDLLASMDAQKNAEEAQLRDDQALEKFFDPTVTTTDPRLSLNPKDWKQQRKERALKLRATKEAIRYEPEERKWLPTYEFDEEEPTDRFFEKMASIMNDANLDRMDEKAWEDLDQWVSEQSQDDQEYIEMDAYGGSLTPKVQEYYDDLEKLEEYFEIEEKYIATRSPEIQDLWKQYRHTNNQSRNESFLWRRLETTLGGLARRLKDYRRKNFEVDRLLAKWDYSGTPYHPANKREFRRIPSRPEFYFSEGEPIQVSPQTGVSIADILEGTSNTRTPAPMAQPTPNGVSIADILEQELVGAR